METTVTYRLLGIPIWTVTKRTAVVDEDAVYERLSKRWSDDMNDALTRAQRPR